MFINEDELSAARNSGDLDQVYRRLVELGNHQLRGGYVRVPGCRWEVLVQDRRDVIHEAACSIVIQIKMNSAKRIDHWHTNMRFALSSAIRRRRNYGKPLEMSLDEIREGALAHEF